MRRALAIAVSLFAIVMSHEAYANTTSGTHDPTRGPDARTIPKTSRSIGFTTRGRLARGVPVRPSRYVRFTNEYARAGHFYGTWEMVQLIERAAYRVARRLPGARLSVGELSSRTGGRLGGHLSHQNGRDADLAFYMLDPRGRPFVPQSFAKFGANGLALRPGSGLRFDDARNWELVAKLVADGDARVQYIFVSRQLRKRLLAEGKKRHAHPVVWRRAAKAMIQPSHGHPHQNHFHVRIYCSPSDRPRCADEGPIHPWYPGYWR